MHFDHAGAIADVFSRRHVTRIDNHMIQFFELGNLLLYSIVALLVSAMEMRHDTVDGNVGKFFDLVQNVEQFFFLDSFPIHSRVEKQMHFDFSLVQFCKCRNRSFIVYAESRPSCVEIFVVLQ